MAALKIQHAARERCDQQHRHNPARRAEAVSILFTGDFTNGFRRGLELVGAVGLRLRLIKAKAVGINIYQTGVIAHKATRKRAFGQGTPVACLDSGDLAGC